MVTSNADLLQQSPDASVPAGCWKLAAGRVMSMHPRTAGVLWIRQGRVWASLDAQPSRRGGGDYVLQAGEQLSVQPGRHLVLESLDGTTLGFEWLPVSAASRIPAQRESLRQPLMDLWFAVRSAGSALLRLLRGLAVYPAVLMLAAYRGLRGL